MGGGTKCTWGRKNLRLPTYDSLYLENGIRQFVTVIIVTVIVSVKGEQEVVCTLSNGDTANDLQ